MTNTSPGGAPASPEFMAALRASSGGADVVPFDRFMQTALYDPNLGYYRRSRPRIGHGTGSDFLTATASAPLFGRLVAAASETLLKGRNPAGHAFVELGAEPAGGILSGSVHPFASERCVRVGDSMDLQGPCIVFSNELFDAQPFRRFRFRAGAWRELGVRIDDSMLREVELPQESSPLPPPGPLPPTAPDGYTIDAPLAAAALAAEIAAQPWTGLFIAIDYGRTWPELARETPAGTASAYHRHTQSNDLLANPGDQDLTCHVCWDWLAEALKSAGFATPTLESQEAFFTHHASAFIASLMSPASSLVDRDKLSLLQLLHPANLGQKFQVLWALR